MVVYPQDADCSSVGVSLTQTLTVVFSLSTPPHLAPGDCVVMTDVCVETDF